MSICLLTILPTILNFDNSFFLRYFLFPISIGDPIFNGIGTCRTMLNDGHWLSRPMAWWLFAWMFLRTDKRTMKCCVGLMTLTMGGVLVDVVVLLIPPRTTRWLCYLIITYEHHLNNRLTQDKIRSEILQVVIGMTTSAFVLIEGDHSLFPS